MDKCANHTRRKADAYLIGVPICKQCARAALIYLLQQADADADERDSAGLQEQLRALS